MYLNNHSYYSFRYGCMKPSELLAEGKRKGATAMALTDVNSTSACLVFAKLASNYEIKPLVGIDFRNGVDQCFVGIAINNEGFKELNAYLSKFLHSGNKFPAIAPGFDNVYVVYPFSSAPKAGLRENERIGISPTEVGKLRFSPYLKFKDKLVVLNTVTFRHKQDFNVHRLLRAIDNNILLSQLPTDKQAEEHRQMLPADEIRQVFADYPYIIENTEKLFDNCHIHFEFGKDYRPKNKRTYTASETEDFRLLKQLCHEAIPYRYPQVPNELEERLKKELQVISQKGFVSYFLINWDIVNYARRQGFFYVGRGSGANSIVAYLLRITDVDPIELDLYFERFINLFRSSPPDFDIDFSWKDRDQVTKYIFDRFPNVALLATYNTFQYKGVINELGKVFGLPKEDIEWLSKGQFEYRQLDRFSKLVLQYGRLIQGFPSHLGIHAGGIIISEKSIHYYTATSLPPKNFPVTHFDMVVAEDVGLYKFDILSQRGLGKIKEALEVVAYNQPNAERIDIHDIKKFKTDEKVKKILRDGDAIGCFYVESPAMRMLLKKLKVDHYLGLVAASSIIRPGVARSGMMREYILRFRDPSRIKLAHPVMRDLMPETFGIMVYQEDVIKVAHYFAGLSLAEADILRRAMSGKYKLRSEFTNVKEKFFSNCKEKGYADKFVAEVWNQIESFSGYAFAKGHSASYAVESYQSLYLKAHYPLEYMVAVINNSGGFYSTEVYVNEARVKGGTVHAPCVNRGHVTTVIYGKHIYLGLSHVSELETGLADLIIEERKRNGAYKNLDDFLDRVEIGVEQAGLLIRANVFRFTGTNKRELMWKAHFRLSEKPTKKYGQRKLFSTPLKEFHVPNLKATCYEDAFDQIELLGFPLICPFALLDPVPPDNISAGTLALHKGRVIVMYGYLATVKFTRTVKGETMYFGTFLDKEGHFFDTVHFPLIAAKFPFRGKGVYRVKGKVVEEFGFYSIETESMKKLPVMEDPRYSEQELPVQKRLAVSFFRSPNHGA